MTSYCRTLREQSVSCYRLFSTHERVLHLVNSLHVSPLHVAFARAGRRGRNWSRAHKSYLASNTTLRARRVSVLCDSKSGASFHLKKWPTPRHGFWISVKSKDQ